jgi:hypothetical protein
VKLVGVERADFDVAKSVIGRRAATQEDVTTRPLWMIAAILLGELRDVVNRIRDDIAGTSGQRKESN